MNYFGKFDAKASDALGSDAPGQHLGGHVYSETLHASHAPSDAIIVPDAQLLFGAEFKRTGVDLVLSGDGREFVLHDYFKGEKHAPLASPDGAHLTGDLVNALAGQVQYAQADGSTSVNNVIGHVSKLAGTATAIRNGVSIILNSGDNVEKGDVVQSGSDSTLGITFIDGTVFGLSSNARMVLNEMVYDPNGSNNSSLLSLVAGTITFVAGETAKHGDMKVDTPVATMGIRGTAVLVEIDFSVPGATPDAKFQVLVEPDGSTGSYILFDKTTLTPLAVVDKAGLQINVSNGVMSQTLAPLAPEIQKLITDVFSLKFSDSTNTKSIEHFTDSIVPNVFGPVNFALINGNVPTTVTALKLSAGPAGPTTASTTGSHVPVAPTLDVISPGSITELNNTTDSTVPDKAMFQFTYNDVNSGDQPTVSVNFASATFQDAQGNIEKLSQLNQLQKDDIAAVEVITNAVQQGTLVNNKGTATWTYQFPDHDFDFLAAGEKLTLTFNAIVDNNFVSPQTGSQTFTITITGSNDVPVITTSQQNIALAVAGTATPGGSLAKPTTGTLAFTDPDLTDTHTASASLVSALLKGEGIKNTLVGQAVFDELASALTAKVTTATDSTGTGTGTIQWTLASLQVFLADFIPTGESLVLTYAVTVTDSAGATSTQDVVFTIGGTNPPGTAWVDTTPVTLTNGVALWSTAANWSNDLTPTINDDVLIGTDQVQPGTPTFPVTVDADACAKSLTMNDFSDFAPAIPELDVESNVKLTIAGALNLNTSTDPGIALNPESIIKNFGTISVGGIATLLQESVLINSGTITLAQGGVFGGQSSITNSGTIEIVADTLNVDVDITNGGGILQVDGSAGLTLNSAIINGGTVSNAGTLNSTGTSAITNATVNGGGDITVADGETLKLDTVTLDDVMLSGSFDNASKLTIKDTVTLNGATVSGGGEIDVGSLAATGATLTLDDAASITDGRLVFADSSDKVFVGTGGATLDGVAVSGGGEIDVGSLTATGVTLNLDAGASITDGRLVFADSSDKVFVGTGGATLDGVAVSGGGEIDVGSLTATGVTLTLDDGATITDGRLVFADSSDKVFVSTGGATLDGVAVSGGGEIDVGSLTATGVTLNLDAAASITDGTLVFADGSDKVFVGTGGATLDGVAVSGGGEIDVGSLTATGVTLTLDDGATIKNGNLTIASGSTLDIESAGGATLDGVTLSGNVTNSTTLTIDDTVKLSGATINGGTIDDTGTLSVTASSEIENATVNGGGDLTVASGATLTLDAVTLDSVAVSGGGEIDVGSLAATGVTLTLDAAASITDGKLVFADNSGKVFVGTGGAMLDGVAVSGGGEIDVGSLTATGVTLNLDDAATITDGRLVFADSSDKVFVGTGGATLDGVAVSGGGEIDVGSLTATGVTLTLDDGASIKNGNLTIASGSTLDIESAKGATLDGVTLSGNVTNSTTLTIDEVVTLNGATISGGTIADTGTLSVTTSSEIENATVDGGGDITVASGNTLTLDTVTLDGVAVSGGGEIDVGSLTATGVTLTLDDGATITDGRLVFADSSDKVFVGTGGATLDGVAVSGGGEIDVGSLTTTGVTLTLDDGTSIKNGNLTIAGGSTLDVESAKGATLDGVTVIGTTGAPASTIEIGATTASGSILTLDDGTSVKNGNMTIAGGSTLDIESAKGATLDGVAVIGVTGASGSLIEIGANTTSGSILTLDDGATIKNGNLTIASGSTLDIESAGGATLDDVTLSGSVTNSTTLTIEDVVTLNGATISGGTIADTGTLSVTASSEIDNATINGGGDITVASGNTLTLNLNNVTLGDVTLSGNVTNSGTLTINDTDTATLNGATITGGTIDVEGELDLTGTSLITDATIINRGNIHIFSGTVDPTPFTNAGIFEVQGPVTFIDEVVTNSLATTNGTIQVDQGGTLTLKTSTITGGIVSNNGTIDVTADSSINDTFSFVNDGTVMADGAALTLANATVGNTKGTFRTIGNGVLDLENTTINGGMLLAGQIATATGNTSSTLNGLTLSSGFVTAVVGVLELTGNISNGGEFDATTGVLDLDNAHITGGTFGGGGTIATTSALNTLSGVTIASGATVQVADHDTLDLVGTISDAGTIALGASGHFTALEISGNVSLTGVGNVSGNVTMTDDSHNFIGSNGSEATLTNSDTISGAGTIGDSHLTLVNSGTIDATGSHALIIDTGVDNSFTAAGFVGNILVTNDHGGVLEASAGHTLFIEDSVLNNGTIEAASNASVTITGNITGTAGMTGSIEIFNNATVEIGGSVSSNQTVTFDTGGTLATSGKLILDDSHHFGGTIVGLTENPVESLENQVDLRDLAYLGPLLTHAHFSHSNDTVTVGNFFDSVTLNVAGNSSGSFEVSSDGHGGTLLSDPAASGTVTVDSNQTLDISAASSATVDFTNTTGTTGALVLDDSKDFIGQVAGFAGDGTTANSDLIDITDVNIADVATDKTTYTDHGNGTGTLALYNASGQALDSINFDGNYQLANFTVENDGDGGTLIVDPPVNTSGQTPGNTTVASNQNSSAAASDGFVFNFAGLTHAPTTDFHPDQDNFQPGGPMLTNPHASNNTPDGDHYTAHENDGHDPSAPILKAHLHAADFHFV